MAVVKQLCQQFARIKVFPNTSGKKTTTHGLMNTWLIVQTCDTMELNIAAASDELWLMYGYTGRAGGQACVYYLSIYLSIYLPIYIYIYIYISQTFV